MGLADDLIRNHQENKAPVIDLNDIKIKATIEKFEKARFGIWSFVYANFGTPFNIMKEMDDIVDKKISFMAIEELKGVNYGKFEHAYMHPCIIISKKQHNPKLFNVVTVIPLTSASTKKPLPDDILIKQEVNTFLEFDSFLIMSKVTTIGLERLDIDYTLRKTKRHTAPVLNNDDRKRVKEKFEEIYLT